MYVVLNCYWPRSEMWCCNVLYDRKSECYCWCYCLVPIGYWLGHSRPVAGGLATELHPLSATQTACLLVLHSEGIINSVSGPNTQMRGEMWLALTGYFVCAGMWNVFFSDNLDKHKELRSGSSLPSAQLWWVFRAVHQLFRAFQIFWS